MPPSIQLGRSADHTLRIVCPNGHLAVFGLAGKFETDAVRVKEVDAEQSRKLWDRPNVIDAARFQPPLDLSEALRCNDEGAVLHRADRVVVAGRFLC